MYVPVEKVDATKKLPHEVFDPVRSQTRYRTSLQVHGKVLGHGIIFFILIPFSSWYTPTNLATTLNKQTVTPTCLLIFQVTWSMCSKTR